MTEILLPPAFMARMNAQLGADFAPFLQSFQQPPCRGMRMRPGRIAPAEALLPVPWADNAYYIPLESTLGANVLHEAGAYYLQEPSAMAAAAALDVQPADRVLDLCAAPGGKSTQIAPRIQSGTLVSNEIIQSRAKILSRNIERMGITRAVVVSAEPEKLAQAWPGWFDKILVDAPCSGEGMFRRHPEGCAQWQPSSPAGCAMRQLAILRSAVRMLKGGGRIVYSTCTFSMEENEGVIEQFLKEFPKFALMPFQLNGLPACDGMLRLWPHKVQGEGHFVALLQHRGAPSALPATIVLPSPAKAEIAAYNRFAKDYLQDAPLPNAAFMSDLICAPPLPPLQGIKVLRAGLHLGEARGELFVPNHALALAVTSGAQMPLSEAQALAYLHGETLPTPENLRGWLTPMFEGMQLGWGKASDDQLKNHYPKGLRK